MGEFGLILMFLMEIVLIIGIIIFSEKTSNLRRTNNKLIMENLEQWRKLQQLKNGIPNGTEYMYIPGGSYRVVDGRLCRIEKGDSND